MNYNISKKLLNPEQKQLIAIFLTLFILILAFCCIHKIFSNEKRGLKCNNFSLKVMITVIVFEFKNTTYFNCGNITTSEYNTRP